MVSKIGGGISWLGIWVLFRLMEFRFYALLSKAKTRVCQSFMGGNPRTNFFPALKRKSQSKEVEE